MLFQDVGAPALNRPADFVFAGSLTVESRSCGYGDVFDVLRREIDCFNVGIACYRLRSPLIACFYPPIGGPEGRLNVMPVLLQIVGSGASIDEAWRDWTGHFHVRFQTLFAMRPWEMQTDERNDWERIEQMVDVAAYRREMPHVVRQIGFLTHRRPIPDKIRWEDGTSDRVTLEQVPPEFAALHEGQRFEAEVLRDATSGRLVRVEVVRRLPPLRCEPLNDELWSSLPTTADAPSVDWDEFE
jgi:hypothetical protein